MIGFASQDFSIIVSADQAICFEIVFNTVELEI